MPIECWCSSVIFVATMQPTLFILLCALCPRVFNRFSLYGHKILVEPRSGPQSFFISCHFCSVFLQARWDKILCCCCRYSHDEGETWENYEFSSTKIIIYGLLTEPGEKTTVFSLFGSLPSHHSWIVVQVNLTTVLG